MAFDDHAWQPYLQIADRQISHVHVQPLHRVLSASVLSRDEGLTPGSLAWTALGCDHLGELVNRICVRAEIIADPVEPFIVAFVVGVAEDSCKVVESGAVSTVFPRTCETTVGAGRIGPIRIDGQPLLQGDAMLPSAFSKAHPPVVSKSDSAILKRDPRAARVMTTMDRHDARGQEATMRHLPPAVPDGCASRSPATGLHQAGMSDRPTAEDAGQLAQPEPGLRHRLEA
jgi:hypothetical protein